MAGGGNRRARLADLARFTIPGEPAAKGNQRKVAVVRGRPSLIKSAKGLAFEAVAKLHVPHRHPPFEGDVGIEVDVFYATERPDLDASLIKDALQGRVIANDRQVREEHVYHGIDRDKPRCEVVVFALGPRPRSAAP